MDEAAIFDELGEEGFRQLVSAFYRRIPGDDLLGPMYPSNDMEGAQERLHDFALWALSWSCWMRGAEWTELQCRVQSGVSVRETIMKQFLF